MAKQTRATTGSQKPVTPQFKLILLGNFALVVFLVLVMAWTGMVDAPALSSQANRLDKIQGFCEKSALLLVGTLAGLIGGKATTR